MELKNIVFSESKTVGFEKGLNDLNWYIIDDYVVCKENEKFVCYVFRYRQDNPQNETLIDTFEVFKSENGIFEL